MVAGELDAAHGEGSGPELGFHGGGLLLRQMFFPQDLIAVRAGSVSSKPRLMTC